MNGERKFNNWIELLEGGSCFVCQKQFTENDKEEGNYLITYADCYGVKEIHHLYHKKYCQGEKRLGNCDICQKDFHELIALDGAERRYHPECLEKDKFARFHTHPKIVNLKNGERKITASLDDGREFNVPISWLVEKWGWPKDIKSEQLKNYQIDDQGFRVYFEDTELDITVFMFTEGTYLGRCGCC